MYKVEILIGKRCIVTHARVDSAALYKLLDDWRNRPNFRAQHHVIGKKVTLFRGFRLSRGKAPRHTETFRITTLDNLND